MIPPHRTVMDGVPQARRSVSCVAGSRAASAMAQFMGGAVALTECIVKPLERLYPVPLQFYGDTLVWWLLFFSVLMVGVVLVLSLYLCHVVYSMKGIGQAPAPVAGASAPSSSSASTATLPPVASGSNGSSGGGKGSGNGHGRSGGTVNGSGGTGSGNSLVPLMPELVFPGVVYCSKFGDRYHLGDECHGLRKRTTEIRRLTACKCCVPHRQDPPSHH